MMFHLCFIFHGHYGFGKVSYLRELPEEYFYRPNVLPDAQLAMPKTKRISMVACNFQLMKSLQKTPF